MAEFSLRAVVAGVVVASLPVVARAIGPTAAGLLMLVPAVTLVSLVFVWQESGTEMVATVAVRAVAALPAVAGFLLTVWAAVRRGLPVPGALVLGLAAWTAVALVALGLMGAR